MLRECNYMCRLSGNFNETFATENSGLANCAQLPPFGGASPVTAAWLNKQREMYLCRRNF
jgi:hypothetical protein